MKLTVVGPDKMYPNKEKAKVGDKVILRKDPTSEYPDVIKVFNESGDQLGNVANSSHTTVKGTKRSSEVYGSLEGEVKGVVEEITSVTFRDGNKSIALIIKTQKEKENKKTKGGIAMQTTGVKKEGLFIVGGSKEDGHINRYEPAKLLKKGEEVPVELQFLEDKVIVLYNGASCGEVSKVVSSDGYDSVDDLISMAEKFGDSTEDIEATLTGMAESIKYALKVKFKGETALERVINEVKKNKLLSDQEISKRMKWLDKLTLNEKNIIHIFQNIGRVNNDRVPKGDFVFINSDSIAEVVIASYNAGLNILLEGPKASGKNTLIEDIGRLYNVPVYEMQINAQTDNETILGSKTLKAKDSAKNKEEINNCIQAILAVMSGDDTLLSDSAKTLMKTLINGEDDEEKATKLSLAQILFSMDFTPLIEGIKGGETEVHFEPSVLVRAMEEGGIIIFDEINTGHPSVMALLNSVLDNRRRIQVPGYGLVKAHPNFRAFATMNKDYQGTFEMNEATASRFVPVVFEEPTSIKDIIKKNVPNVEKNVLEICDKIYKDIRKKTRTGAMQSQSINIRAFIYTCIQVEWGIPLKTALINNVANSCPDLDDREGIKKLIDLLIA